MHNLIINVNYIITSMKTKALLAALSLPLMFTACSQDEWMEDAVQNGNMKADGIKVALNVTKNYENENGAQTRAEWDETSKAIKFESGDKISVYWLGEETTWETATAKANLDVKFNSIFRTTDGASFTSEAMVFQGGNIAVFPADVTVSSQGTNKVTVKVPDTQDATTIEKVPYISNQLYVYTHGNKQESQKPGYYGEGGLPALDAPVKMAANVVNLTINLSNIPEGYDFAVQSVSLVEDGSTGTVTPFVKEAEVKTIAAAPKYEGKVKYDNTTAKKATIISQAWVTPKATEYCSELKTTALQGANTATVKARFVVLPTEKTVAVGNAKIVIRTNCGTIEIDDAGKNTDTYDILKADGSRTSIVAAINEFITSGTSTTTGGKFEGENIGKNFARTINVDASTAELNGSEVYSDADIKRYISLYGAMGKTGAMKLVLSSTATKNLPTNFAGLTRAAVSQVDANANFSLVAKNAVISGVEIVGGGEVFSIKNITSAGGASSVKLVLGEGNWTMDDTFKLFATGVATNPLNEIENHGTLTIKGTLDQNDDQNKVVATIYNVGTIKLGGNNVVKFGTLRTRSNSIIDIEAGQELQFADNVATRNLYGTVNVKNGAFLTVANGMTAVNNGVINNYGTIASAGSTGGLVNAVDVLDTDARYNSAAAIYVKDDAAITYVQDNAAGNIYLKNRNDEVRVESASKGNIQYNYDYAKDGATFKQYPADKFTAVLFGTDASAITLHKSVVDSSTGSITDGTVLPTNTNLYFSGNTKLTSDNITVKSLNVLSGNLQFTTGNVLNVETLLNKGTITIGGTIWYSVYGGYANNGRVLSVGGGAIELVTAPAGTSFAATASGNYVVSATTAVTSVNAGVTATLLASSAQNATVTKANLANINGDLVIGSNVTLTIGATDGTDYTFTDASVTAVDVATLNATASVLTNMKTQLDPSTKNISAKGGKIMAYFKATLTASTMVKVLEAEWDGTDWEIKTVS